MVEGVVQSEQIAVDQHGPRYPDVLAECAGHPFRNAGFSISWIAVEEHSSPAIDSWAEFGEEVRRNE